MSLPPTNKTRPIRTGYYNNGDVDFDELAANDPEFAAICQGGKKNRWIDFQDPEVVQRLTKSLLKYDFGLTLTLPPDRLCPPVPVRWNYIRWIQDLLDTTTPHRLSNPPPPTPIIGLDIGTGASAIYPLLSTTSRPTWHLHATDIDAHSLTYAKTNIQNNTLTAQITLHHMTDSDPLIPLSILNEPNLSFTLTNPPFYSTPSEITQSYALKPSQPPSAMCTGAENEMLTPGGDLGFVTRILTESLVLRKKIRWYTAMFGHLASLQAFVALLRERGVGNYAVTTLHAGSKTRRWAVGWSFWGWRAREDVGRGEGVGRALWPAGVEWTLGLPLVGVEEVGERAGGIVQGLEGGRWGWEGDAGGGGEGDAGGGGEGEERVGVLWCEGGDCWSRAARRRAKFQGQEVEEGRPAKRRKLQDGEGEDREEEEKDVAFGVEIRCRHEAVDVRWLYGHDSIVFQSFCGFLKRALTTKT